MNEPSRERQSLATGFRNVDASGDTGACSHCLDLIAGIPFFRDVKRDSIKIMAAACPQRVMDAGCGAGVDLVALAGYLQIECQIVGIDRSASLLARAADQTAKIKNQPSLVKGDVMNTPFHDRTFDACRIDRVLQHILKPEQAIHELARILAPGGSLIAFDNDWDTFSISLDDKGSASRIAGFWRDSFASGRVGRDLPRLFRDCGLVEVHVEPRTLVLNDLSVAEQVFDLPLLLERMVQAGEITPHEAAAVRDELRRRACEGRFTSGYTGYLVQGKKVQ